MGSYGERMRPRVGVLGTWAVLLMVAGSIVTVSRNGGASSGATSSAVGVRPSAANVSLTPAGGVARPVGAELDARVGDSVATDVTGRAELRYRDGSFTRLGPSTTVAVIALADSRSGTRIGISVGTIWQRVTQVTGSSGNSVETPVGVATVRGTAYAASCAAGPACTFTVAESVVEITPLVGPPVTLQPLQRVTVTPAGAGPVETLTPEQLTGDVWVAENLTLDSTALTTTTTTSPPPTSPGTAAPAAPTLPPPTEPPTSPPVTGSGFTYDVTLTGTVNQFGEPTVTFRGTGCNGGYLLFGLYYFVDSQREEERINLIGSSLDHPDPWEYTIGMSSYSGTGRHFLFVLCEATGELLNDKYVDLP